MCQNDIFFERPDENALTEGRKVAGQIVYLLILIVLLCFAPRKCKRNGGRVQTTVHVNASGDADSDTSGNQIAMSPSFLAVNATIAC